MNGRLFQFGVFVVSVVGYVGLAIWGEPTAEYVTLIGPVLAAAYLTTRLGKQDQVLDKINEQTNGILTRRIKDAVRAVLDERPSDSDGTL